MSLAYGILKEIGFLTLKKYKKKSMEMDKLRLSSLKKIQLI
jgi:hypothetical protein